MGTLHSKEPMSTYYSTRGFDDPCHDRLTHVEVYEARAIVGTRQNLALLQSEKGRDVIWNQLGLIVHTKGNRLMRNSTIVVTDYCRYLNGTWKKQHKQSTGTWGAAEASGALRIGDVLFSVNGTKVANRSRRQVQSMIQHLMEVEEYPILLEWKHPNTSKAVAWEDETCMPPPQGEYYQTTQEMMRTRPTTKYTSVSI